MNHFDTSEIKQPEKNVCVVRLKTSVWADKSGLHTKRSLTFLRRQCVGHNMLEEDAGAAGTEAVITRILNLDECKDGIYEAITCNESHDFESGYIDDYDYRLVPLSAPAVPATTELPTLPAQNDDDSIPAFNN